MKMRHIFESHIDKHVDDSPEHPAGNWAMHAHRSGLQVAQGDGVRVPKDYHKQLKHAPVQKVPVKHLIHGQGYLVRDKVKALAKQPHGTGGPVAIIHQDGKHYIKDGNHRSAVAHMKGESHIDAKVIDAAPDIKRRR
jgi:hypothetical protein